MIPGSSSTATSSDDGRIAAGYPTGVLTDALPSLSRRRLGALLRTRAVDASGYRRTKPPALRVGLARSCGSI